MKICIIHYHLKLGGVTRVIQSQVKSLYATIPNCEISIICGECPNPEFYENMGVQILICKHLNYLSKDYTTQLLETYFQKILGFLKRNISKNHIVHTHNINLGKNPVATIVLYYMAKEGYKIFNHIHDFAEDRPDNWKFLQEIIGKVYQHDLLKVLYPQLENYKYGTLTKFDRGRLDKKNIHNQQCFILANPIALKTICQSKDELRNKICEQLQIKTQLKIIVYPVRAIRRKNIGEFVLILALFNSKIFGVLSLPPSSSQDIISYERWKKFCEKNLTNIYFDAGAKVGYEELLISCDFCITTSKQEGFGMAYLEPWLVGTPVVGRNIKSVTDDFIKQDIVFPFLYDKLSIPEISNDFKDLTECEQEKIIEQVLSCDDYKKTLLSHNTIEQMFIRPHASILTRNLDIIKQYYSIDNYGKKLQKIYQSFTRQY